MLKLLEMDILDLQSHFKIDKLLVDAPKSSYIFLNLFFFKKKKILPIVTKRKKRVFSDDCRC